jgi:hypothetical protein
MTLSLCIAIASYIGVLPTQAGVGEALLTRMSAKAQKIKSGPSTLIGKDYVRVSFPISKVDLGRALPEEVTVSVTLKPTLPEQSWRVLDDDFYDRNESDGIQHDPQPTLTRNLGLLTSVPVSEFDIKLHKLRADESYTLVLFLWKDGVSAADAERMSRLVKANKDAFIELKTTWDK